MPDWSTLPGDIDEWRVIGDPTEGAMIVLAAKAGIDKDKINEKQPRLQEIPFDSKRKLMTTFTGQTGAADCLYKRCPGYFSGTLHSYNEQ